MQCPTQDGSWRGQRYQSPWLLVFSAPSDKPPTPQASQPGRPCFLILRVTVISIHIFGFALSPIFQSFQGFPTGGYQNMARSHQLCGIGGRLWITQTRDSHMANYLHLNLRHSDWLEGWRRHQNPTNQSSSTEFPLVGPLLPLGSSLAGLA